MTLTYKFKKEQLGDGSYVSRPRILVEISGEDSTFQIPALIDTGCDTSVISESMAKLLGLDMTGKRDFIYAYREANEVLQSTAKITLLGREHRQHITITIPILIALSKEGTDDEQDITLGINGIFDMFEITFNKSKNKITFKQENLKNLTN